MIIKCDSRQEIKHEEKGDLYCKQEGRERWGQVEKWLEVGVCKERSLEKNHLERSSKAGEGGWWDVSAKVSSFWNNADHLLHPYMVFYLNVAGSVGG